LKRRIRLRPWRPAPSIRGARASASLKRNGLGLPVEAGIAHPRRTRLGLIEARMNSWFDQWRDPTIRGARASASLKHARARTGDRVHSVHPRRTRLGLIEA